MRKYYCELKAFVMESTKIVNLTQTKSNVIYTCHTEYLKYYEIKQILTSLEDPEQVAALCLEYLFYWNLEVQLLVDTQLKVLGFAVSSYYRPM